MPLYNESVETIAQAIVTVKRAIEEGVIYAKNYKGLNKYLKARGKDFKITKKNLSRANKDLDDELRMAVDGLYMEVGDELFKMAEDLLIEHQNENCR